MKKVISRKPAVFLDRDGTLIHDAGYLNRLSQIRLFEETIPALKLLRGAGYRLFVVSNQSGVARGYFSESSVIKANRRIQALLKFKGVRIDRFFYCPHYPHGKVKSLAIDCDCRKPRPGMVKEAASRFPLDLRRSYVVGDKMDDLFLAQRARLKGGVLVRTGKGRKSEKELKTKKIRNAVVASDILKAARWIAAQKESK